MEIEAEPTLRDSETTAERIDEANWAYLAKGHRSGNCTQVACGTCKITGISRGLGIKDMDLNSTCAR
jgi:hypothetical protein